LLRSVQTLQRQRCCIVTHTSGSGLVCLPRPKRLSQQRAVVANKGVHASAVRVNPLASANEEAFRKIEHVLVRQLQHGADEQ
jgi:hypothetical protein